MLYKLSRRTSTERAKDERRPEEKPLRRFFVWDRKASFGPISSLGSAGFYRANWKQISGTLLCYARTVCAQCTAVLKNRLCTNSIDSVTSTHCTVSRFDQTRTVSYAHTTHNSDRWSQRYCVTHCAAVGKCRTPQFLFCVLLSPHDCSVAVKVVTIEQATKAQRGSRGIALLFP